MNTKNNAPLAGIKVIDLSAYIAAPSACALLADMGADVIKVEPPDGDALRQYPSTLAAEPRAFMGVNRSKHGIVIDLKKSAGLEILKRLVRGADILVQNFRPGVVKRLGIGYAAFSAENPRLIYCSLTGYGESGPLAGRAGYDQVLQAISGICASQGLGKAQPEIVYGSVVDFYAGAMLAGAVCAALYQRERTTKGQQLGVSLLGAALAMQATRMVWADREPRTVERDMRSGGITGIHPCAGDTYIYLSANTSHFWKALCRHLGEPALAGDPQFDTVRKRAVRAQDIIPLIRQALQKHTAPEWEEIFGDDVPCGAVRPVEDMFEHPQVRHEGLIAHMTHANAGGYKGFAGAFQFADSAKPAPLPAPALGQHTDEILRNLEFSRAEIERLHSEGVV